MDKMDYPRNLISYTSENRLEGGTTHWLRPRLIGYVLVLSVMVSVFSYTVFSRIPLEMTVIRDRTNLFVQTDAGDIDNIYSINLVNMDEAMHEFEITLEDFPQGEIIGDTLYTLDSGEVRTLTLRVRANPETLDRPSTEISFEAVSTDMPSLRAASESRFMKPL
jgi:polyferredoxin